MSEIPNGGPAFPGTPACGMSLRDYFAAKAIDCFEMSEESVRELQEGTKFDHKLVATFCYDLADAMLKARDM